MMHILLIDDDPLVRELLVEIMEHAGFQVSSAENGRLGLEILASGAAIDLVITDLVMTHTDGLTVIRTMRERYPQIPLVAVSGGSPDFDVDLLIKLARVSGVDATIKKPFNAKDLVEAVERTLASRAAGGDQA